MLFRLSRVISREPSDASFLPLACVALAGSLLLSLPAQATPARVVGLGDLTRYVEDDTSVQLYPGQLGQYSNFVFFDLGGPGGVAPTLGETQRGGLNGGAFFRVGDKAHLGILTSNFIPGEHRQFLQQVARNANIRNEPAFSALVPETALRRYDVLAAYEFDRRLTAGLRVAYGARSETFVPDEDDRDIENEPRKKDVMGQSQFQASLGASGEFQQGGYDVSFEYAHFGATYDKNGEAAFLGGGGNAFGINARARFDLSDHWSIVPQVGWRATAFALREDSVVPSFGFGDPRVVERLVRPGGEDDDYVDRLHRRSSQLIDAGAAGVLRPTEKSAFIVALGTRLTFNNTSTDIDGDDGLDRLTKESTTIYSLPYVKFGFEAAVLDWLVLRGGAEKFTWARRTVESFEDRLPDGNSFERQESGHLDVRDFDVYVGASVLFHGFQLDLLVDREFLRRGPAFISGDNGQLAARASLAYRF